MGLACPARAESIYGTFQTQYQRLDERQLLVAGDGTTRTRLLQQSFWLRTLDVHHQDWARPNLLLESNVRYTDQTYLGLANVTRTPVGSLRVIHPRFQVLASHQPASQTSSLSSQSGLNPDAVTTRKVTSHNLETLITGHVALPRAPQVDASWIRRRRDGAGSVADRNTSRNLRLTMDRERWSAYGGVNDQDMSSQQRGAGRNTQQVWTAGGAYHLVPRPSMALNAQYDVSDVRGVASGARRPSTMTHAGSLAGEWRPAARWLGSANYSVRHVDLGTSVVPPQTDHEGSAIARYQLSRRSSLLGGGGIRTLRTLLPSGTADVSLQKYLTALAAVEARVRRNWNMTGGLSHTTNFDPGRAAWNIETLSGSSRGQLTRRIQVDGALQVTANGDSGAVASRWSSAWTARIQGQPLRALQLAYSQRGQRTGAALSRPGSVAGGRVVDVTWRPATNLQLVGQYGSSSARPANANRNSTRSLTARYQPTRRLNCAGTWTRSDQTIVISTAGQVSSREVVSGRVQYDSSRRLAMSAGMSYNDPGRALESKRLDLALTWSFGR